MKEVLTGAGLSVRRPLHLPLPAFVRESNALRLRNSLPGGLIWTRTVNRGIGAMIALALRGTRVSPNWVTVAGLGVNLLAALFLVSVRGRASLIDITVLVVLWQLAFGLDCADGLLARERGQATPFGAWLDQVVDLSTHVLLFTSVMVYLVRVMPLEEVLAVLLMGWVIGLNLLQLFAASQRNSIMGRGPMLDGATPAWLARLTRARHLVDFGALLFVIAFLLALPPALLAVLVISGALSGLAVLAQVVINWRRQGRVS